MQDSVFLDNRTFQRVWQRVAGSIDAPVTTPPEADTLTDLLAECIRAKAAGATFYTALSQRIRTGRQQLLGIAAQERAHQKELQVEYFLRTGERCVPPAACPRLGTAAQDLRCVYTQELKLAERPAAAVRFRHSPPAAQHKGVVILAAAQRGGGEPRAAPAAPNAGRHGAAGPLPRPSRAKPARLPAGLRQIRTKNAFLSKWYLTL